MDVATLAEDITLLIMPFLGVLVMVVILGVVIIIAFSKTQFTRLRAKERGEE